VDLSLATRIGQASKLFLKRVFQDRRPFDALGSRVGRGCGDSGDRKRVFQCVIREKKRINAEGRDLRHALGVGRVSRDLFQSSPSACKAGGTSEDGRSKFLVSISTSLFLPTKAIEQQHTFLINLHT
jgi:hypothetical protein